MKHNCIVLSAAVIFLAACGGPQESESIKEAKVIHAQLTQTGDELHDAISEAMAPLEGQIDSAMMVGDTLLAADLVKTRGKLDRIHVRFHEWSETVVEIPGQACTHDHDHDHGDHEGHDHSHDHGAQAPEGLSDEQILEIQQALLDALNGLKAEFERATE